MSDCCAEAASVREETCTFGREAVRASGGGPLSRSDLSSGAGEVLQSAATEDAALGSAQVESVDIGANPYRVDFPLLVARPDIAFLDSAATAQRPACVLDAQRRFSETMNANPLRGLYSLSVEATEAIAQVRAQVAGFVGARDTAGQPCAGEVVFCRNATEALNLVAKSFAPTVLSPGDEVAVTVMEHHSNLIPWQQACRMAGARLVRLYPSAEGELSDEEIAAKIGPRTKIVACATVSNVLGVRLPVEKLSAAAHAHGGYVVLDAAQSTPHMPTDVRALGADFLAFSAHKAFGPFGIGLLWGRAELLAAMPPMLTGGEMIDSVTEIDAVWAAAPERFEAGTQDAAGIYATGVALDYLVNQVGYSAVQAREAELMRYALSGVAQMPFIDILGPCDAALRHGVISFNVRGVHPHDVASILDMRKVCIRAGHHCAQPLLTWLACENFACCRASFAFYNDRADVDALLEGLESVHAVFAA